MTLRPEPALAVRDACLGWLPFGSLLARLGDPIVRRWMQRTGSPYVGDIDAVARTLNRPGIWLLHGAYLFGCTAFADEAADGPRLRRTLDWPFPGLGRLVEVVLQRGPAGEFLNVTWPGFTGVLTATAPGRFAASINQAPMGRRRTISPRCCGSTICSTRSRRSAAGLVACRPSMFCAGPSRPAPPSMKHAISSKRRRWRGRSCSFSSDVSRASA